MKSTANFVLAMIIGFVAGFLWVMTSIDAKPGSEQYAAY